MKKLLFIALVALLPSASLRAAPVDDLLGALGIAEIVAVMHEEGLRHGEQLAEEMLPRGPSSGWAATVEKIYAEDWMFETVRAGFARGMEGTDLAPLLAFFQSDIGKRIVDLEISARRAMIDADVEDAARDAYRRMQSARDPRLAEITRFVEINDLVEANTVGALNSNFMFYLGLADGGALDISEDEMVSEVWAQEEETRRDTEEWVYAFLMLAYGPLEEGVVARYADLSETPEGQALNQALFAGFNQMYDDISYALGRAVALQLQAQDL